MYIITVPWIEGSRFDVGCACTVLLYAGLKRRGVMRADFFDGVGRGFPRDRKQLMLNALPDWTGLRGTLPRADFFDGVGRGFSLDRIPPMLRPLSGLTGLRGALPRAHILKDAEVRALSLEGRIFVLAVSLLVPGDGSTDSSRTNLLEGRTLFLVVSRLVKGENSAGSSRTDHWAMLERAGQWSTWPWISSIGYSSAQ